MQAGEVIVRVPTSTWPQTLPTARRGLPPRKRLLQPKTL
jgi:hypothetical protein